MLPKPHTLTLKIASNSVVINELLVNELLQKQAAIIPNLLLRCL